MRSISDVDTRTRGRGNDDGFIANRLFSFFFSFFVESFFFKDRITYSVGQDVGLNLHGRHDDLEHTKHLFRDIEHIELTLILDC